MINDDIASSSAGSILAGPPADHHGTDKAFYDQVRHTLLRQSARYLRDSANVDKITTFVTN